jgi:hypothetical protein
MQYPSNLIYALQVVMALRSCKDPLPDDMHKIGVQLWNDVDDGCLRPDHMFTREGLFSESSAAGPTRILKTRKLHNEVMGILARVTPENYDTVRGELLALPIKQSEQSEIDEVVKTFFRKSIRPEDQLFSEYYTRLIVDLIQYVGAKEHAGQMIRRAVVTQCQQTFENDNLLEDADRVASESAPTAGATDEERELAAEEVNVRRKQVKDKLKANITFLGLLFINGLVHEKVTTMVLFKLLYGDVNAGRRRREPQDYEVEMFSQLLLKIGPKITKEHTGKYMDQFKVTLKEISTTHKEKRIQFLALDTLEAIDNNWEKKRGVPKGPMKISDFDNCLVEEKDRQRTLLDQQSAIRRGGGASVPMPGQGGPTHAAMQPTAILRRPQTSQKDVANAYDKFFQEQTTKDVAAALKDLDHATRIDYTATWVSRYMTTVRMSKERAQLGELFTILVHDGVLSPADVLEVFTAHVEHWISNAYYEEQVRYFNCWAQTIKAGNEALTYDFHTMLLRKLLDSRFEVPRRHIIAMISEVVSVTSSNLCKDLKLADLHKRFRIIPPLLTYLDPLIPNGEEDEEPLLEGVDAALGEEGANALSAEVRVFLLLYNDDLKSLKPYIEKHPDRGDPSVMVQATCAAFAFSRFDDKQFFFTDKCLPIFQFYFPKSAQPNNTNREKEALMLLEVYCTWLEMDRQPSDALPNFLMWLLKKGIIAKPAIDKLILDMTKHHKPHGQQDAKLIEHVAALETERTPASRK